MGWAILWGLIIGGVSNNGAAGFLAFCVIWYFEDKSTNAPKIINALQQKIVELESENWDLKMRIGTQPKSHKEWYEYGI